MLGMTSSLGFAVVVAAFGSGFQHGFSGAVVNPAQPVVQGWIRGVVAERQGVVSSDVSGNKLMWIWAAVVAVTSVGGIIGGACTSIVAAKFGRRGGLIVNNVLVFLAVILYGTCKTSRSYEVLLVGRFVIGINNGLSAGLCPMYINEISPRQIRGAAGSLYELFVNVGSVTAFLLGLEVILGTDRGWPYLFGIMAAPAIIQTILLHFCPETPVHLLATRRTDMDAREALMWLRDTDDIDEEVRELAAQKDQPEVSIKDFFANRSLRAPLIIAVATMLSQQLSGISAVTSYSTSVLVAAKMPAADARLASLGVDAVKLLASVAAAALADVAGRRAMLLAGHAAVCTAATALCGYLAHVESVAGTVYVAMLLLGLFVAGFAMGPGPVPWFLVDELFCYSATSTASSIAVSCNWLSNLAVALFFLPLQDAMGPYVFLIFAVVSAVSVIFVWFKLPETKGKTTEEIAALFT